MSLAGADLIPPTARRRAYSAGVAAGMLTLAVGWLALAQLGWPGVADASPNFTLEAGDCLRVTDDPSVVQAVDCSVPHDGEVAGIATHPDRGRPFPGDEVTRVWFEQGCRDIIAEYLGADHLTTTLNAGVVVPTEGQWNDGVHHATCHVSTGQGTESLTGSVKSRADDFARSDIVAINRLLPGDCFEPAGSNDSFSLRSGDMVRLADCSGQFSGLFFGRADLSFPDDVPIPADSELTEASTAACSAAFEAFFDVESAAGYTFRFWRPSQSRWNDGERQVLCAVLSDDPIEGPYTPVDYPELDKLGTGQCFRLLPEQTPDSLSLDDHVRPVRCSELHSGQMIGSGRFDTDLPFPGDTQSSALTEQECRSLFEAFIGVRPVDSEFGRFPYWYPDEDAWTAGDTRYACAVLGDGLTESLQGSRR